MWTVESLSLNSMLQKQLFLPRLRGKPKPSSPIASASPAVLGLSSASFQVALSVSARTEQRGALSNLAREHCLPCHKLTSSPNYLGGTEGKISNSFSFPANCSHPLPQFWLDSPFPLSSASTARLSPPHPSPPSPRTSKVITIMN